MHATTRRPRQRQQSKLLLKPLNIQTGETGGRQDGVRYERDNSGYQVVRDWVVKQGRLQR